MKRVISIALVLLLVLALGVTAAGCKSTGGKETDAGKYGDAIPGGVGDVSAEVLEALMNSGNIVAYSCHVPAGNDESANGKWWKEFHEYYAEVYNGTVEVIPDVQWEGWESKYITDFAANDAPDLIYAFEKNWPKLANRGMIYSVNEMKEAGVVGFDHPYLVDGLDQVAPTYTYKGELYTFAKNMAEPAMIFVNEDLFKEYSVKSPSEYYAEGTWNWVNFEKAASELTRDTNADEATDIYGYVGWDANYVVTAAGGRIITLKDDGSLAVTMDSIEAMQGFENVHNIYGTLGCASNNSSQTEFASGKIGMIAYMPRNMYNYMFGLAGTDKLTFNCSMIPYPLDDRTNKESIREGKSYSWVVSSSCENPQGCINYMIAYNAFMKANPNEADRDYILTKCFTEEQNDMIADCARQAVVPIYQGVGTLWGAQWDFWTNLKRSKTTVTEHIEAYKPMFQQQVDLENDSATH